MPRITLENGNTLEVSNESYRKMCQAYAESQQLVTPDGIWFETINKEKDGRIQGIVKGKSLLFVGKHSGIINIQDTAESYTVQNCLLQPCKREDLKAGDVCFSTDAPHFLLDLSNKCHYCVIKNDKEYVRWYTEYNPIEVSELTWPYWYKVLPPKAGK